MRALLVLLFATFATFAPTPGAGAEEDPGTPAPLATLKILIVGSCDAEAIAVGPSGKGPGRGAILRHGANTLWSATPASSSPPPTRRPGPAG